MNPIQIKKRYSTFLEESCSLIERSYTKHLILRFIYPVSKKFFEKNYKNSISNNSDSYQFYYENYKGNYIISSKNLLLGFNNTAKKTSSIELHIKKLPQIIVNHESIKINKNLPLFICTIPFKKTTAKNEWYDFNKYDYFIPQSMFIKNGKYYFIIFNTTISKESDIKKSELLFNRYLQEFNIKKKPVNSSVLPELIKNYTADNEKKKWYSQVNYALQKINSGFIDKIVLSKREKITLKDSINFSDLLNRLKKKKRDSYLFAFKSKNSIFCGLSPEKLFDVKKEMLSTEALAGSIKRGKNRTEDKKLANALLSSQKNFIEHKSVVDFLIKELKPVSDKIYYRESPIIKKLKNIQHLWIPIEAKLKANVSIFKILEKLFPTPAVCGTPKEKAMKLINEIEDFDRGLFTGIIGWFNLNSEAEFVVSIRSALFNKKNLYVYAGCGIVSTSDPVLEFEEADLKFKTVISLFEK
jgi:menaquinone-specific isochorismate synthase